MTAHPLNLRCVFLVLAFIPLLASRLAAVDCAGLNLFNLLPLPAAFGFRPDAKYTHRHTKQRSFGSAPGAAWSQAVEGSDAVPQSGILQSSPGATPSPLATPVSPRLHLRHCWCCAEEVGIGLLWKGRWWGSFAIISKEPHTHTHSRTLFFECNHQGLRILICESV